MPAIHRGCMSKHPAWVKMAILEYLEERLKEAAERVDIGEENVKVYDPFTTEWDFCIFIDASWSDYLKLYAEYYDTSWEVTSAKAFTDAFAVRYAPYVGTKIKAKISSAIHEIGPEDTEREIFNASTSKTEIYYTIQQMKDILEKRTPVIPE